MDGAPVRAGWTWVILTLALVVAAFFAFSRPRALSPGDLPAHEPDVANGELVYHAGGCAGCHGERLEGGLEMHTAFGTFHVPNISPDRETGIGAWDTLDFVNSMCCGVSPDGRHYYPAFPYPSYARMDTRDVIDLKAWIDTFDPVSNSTRGHELRFPWSVRRGIGLWKRRYLDTGPVISLEDSTAVLERGRYLVESAGHCGECHTARDRFGGPDLSLWLGGAPELDGEGVVPDITPHADGLGDWSERDIAWYLKSGFTPDYDTVGGSMVKVQENLARLPDSDRAAIAAYLKAIPAVSRRESGTIE